MKKSKNHNRVLKWDAEIAEFLDIEKPKTVFVIYTTIETFNWIEYQQAVNRREKIKEKDPKPNIKNIKIDKLYQKIVFVSTETKTTKKKKEIEECKPLYTKLVNQIVQEKETNYTCQDYATKKIKEAPKYQKTEKQQRDKDQKELGPSIKEQDLARIILGKSIKEELKQKRTFHARPNNFSTNMKEGKQLSSLKHLKTKKSQFSKKKNQVSLTKTSQFMESKSYNNKENKLEDVIEIITESVLENLRECIFDLIKKDPRLKKMAPNYF
ncbi:39525_t:CDS:2 [Gigaspora margarita]|uniref:39525_t:CDS:1 n=1 Tax=Gigaspora margarita TaxID=4874 RepID=A0ABN7UHA4_GIGMA|nr:39525_t:CDS:2 [Gigaspora margarita]